MREENTEGRKKQLIQTRRAIIYDHVGQYSQVEIRNQYTSNFCHEEIELCSKLQTL